ncbi:uncharacterized protein SPPG_09417 [Spizellomyces punctatus DAOM BR117]|uniref:Translin n=1 Tax=Spizellomyces punctatus (strain DAOM BR117) TaxID=645134 RepID=A0A0L0HA44_SPIPD|nr:uncharacterized protein SPPG_09417 [Spizellomyces punctatus DAOM BR117]KNC97881.1 hypothetical protein SPPG_09417 [Spizellomyces punctatus DAOM BR117]|eukprot:XP_016605921.1 hypothetical protein SPPG_09417 [Spizellomyces punctatus DAOM BR117]
MADLIFFESIQRSLETETELRENIRTAVRDLERTCRTVAAILSQVHSATTDSDVGQQVNAALDRFANIRADIQNVAKLVPHEQYYRYNGMFTFTLQQAIFLAAYIVYLQTEKLLTVPQVEEMLGVEVSLRGTSPTFHIGIEDYLHGLVSITSELSRLAVNCVTHGDYSRPLRISKFVGDLYSGFQLLNLKNDALRKRFDSIKYDVKKIEEVVYDISVRGLAGNQTAEKR